MRLKGLQLFVALATAVALAFGISAAADVGSGSGPPTSVGTGGAAASVERLATQAGIDILRRGGNAVDAAVAAAAVLGVTEPFSCGIGGGGFMVLRTADGAVTTIDGRETAPAAMHPTSFWENGVALPFNAARYSGLSVGVPGTVETWVDALEKFGTMSLAEVFAPAIHVARHGYVIDQVWFDQANANRDWFDDIPASAALFLDADGTPRDVGTVFTNPALAETYERIAHLGAKGFYRGAVADALVEAVQHPAVSPSANHVWRPGVMTMRDLHAYTAPERAPTHVNYRGLDVYSMGPPSSGGSTVGEALNILEGYDLSSMTPRGGPALLPRSVALLVRRPQRLPRGSRLLRRPAEWSALRRVRRDAPCADHRHGSAGRRSARRPAPLRRRGDDDAPDDLGQLGERGLVHVHDRVDGRRGPRCPRLRVPAQQRADGLQLRLNDPSEPRRGRQAAAQLDGADDRHESRRAVPRARLAGRRDDHHHRAPDPARSRRPRHDAFRRRSPIRAQASATP